MNYRKAKAIDVVFALAAADCDAANYLQQMVDNVEMKLRVLKMDDNDCCKIVRDHIATLEQWMRCLQYELEAQRKINSQFPVLQNKG